MEIASPALIKCLKSQRWFQDKHSSINSISLIDSFVLSDDYSLVLASINELDYFYLFFIDRNNMLLTKDQDLFKEFFEVIKKKKFLNTKFGKIVLISSSDEAIDFSGFEKFGEDSTNSLFAVNKTSLFKVLRKVEYGSHPEEIILKALNNSGETPKLKSSIHWNIDGMQIVFVLEQELLVNEGNVWSYLLRNLQSNQEDKQIRHIISTLGEGLASFHNCIFEASLEEPLLKVEVMNSLDLEDLIAQIKALHEENETFLQIPKAKLEAYLSEQKNKIQQSGIKLKTHGDFHLGQILCTKGGYKIIDFEGQPIYSLEERWKMKSPLQDVASLVRSIEYLEELSKFDDPDLFFQLKKTFVDSYCKNAKFTLPQPFESLFNLERLCKIYQELNYEKRVRPDMMWICKNALKEELESVS